MGRGKGTPELEETVGSVSPERSPALNLGTLPTTKEHVEDLGNDLDPEK